ncbi:MAG: hypothetical protein U0670_08450 [Anaerolineae bacterium]
MTKPILYPHHVATIEKLTAHFQADPTVLALIIGGSLAKGWGSESSDVDFMLVVTDEEYARRLQTFDLLYFSRDFSDYEGGYVDGKIIDMAYLHDVLDHGSEPTRAAFLNAIVQFSRIDGLERLIANIIEYPEADREEKMRSFYSQVLLGTWYVGEAVKRNNPYLLARTTADLTLFGGRLILAYNRLLYPYHKWLLRQLENATDKPEGFMDLTLAVLNQPGNESAQAYCEAIVQYRDWGVSFPEAVQYFTRDREWNWRGQKPPIHDW